MKLNRRVIRVLVAAVVLSATGAFASDSPPKDADKATLEKAGFKCEPLGIDSITCSKDGEKDRTCDRYGKCTIL